LDATKKKNAENRLRACTSDWKKEETSWAYCPGKVPAFTTELCIVRILDRELNGRLVKYNHFELENIAFD